MVIFACTACNWQHRTDASHDEAVATHDRVRPLCTTGAQFRIPAVPAPSAQFPADAQARDNEMIVGVKRIGEDVAAPDEPAYASMGIFWAKLGDVELPEAWRDALLGVEFRGDAGFHEVALRFAISGFRTVDWRGDDAPTGFRPAGAPNDEPT